MSQSIVNMIPRNRAQAGLSLVELMIAMVIGLMLIGSMVTVFAGSRQSARVNSTLTELQESARFALDTLARDARMAGFQGCVDIEQAPAQVRASAAPTTNYFASALTAATIDASGAFAPASARPPGFNLPADAGSPVPGTHALSLQFGNPDDFGVEAMASVNDPVVLDNTDPGLVTGDLVLISNCQVADIFAVTGAAGATLAHAAADNNGDNRLSAAYGQNPTRDRSRAMRFEANIYYVGNTGRNNDQGDEVLSLYRQSLPYTNPPVEIVEGVENLQVRLGFAEMNGRAGAADNLVYVNPADAAGQAGQIRSVQIGLLMQSYDRVAQDDDTRQYLLAGTRIGPAASGNNGVTHAGDRRMRLAFNTTVSIRNRR